MQKERTPFSCLLTVFRAAAAEFVTAIQMANEFGFAPAGDEFAAFASPVFIEVTEFHREWSLTVGECCDMERSLVRAPRVMMARTAHRQPVVKGNLRKGEGRRAS